MWWIDLYLRFWADALASPTTGPSQAEQFSAPLIPEGWMQHPAARAAADDLQRIVASFAMGDARED